MDQDRRINGVGLSRQLGAWRSRAEGNVAAGLAERIRLLVLDGRLPLRTRLPAERELAVALEVSRTTVAAAYDRLRQGGLLHSRQGSGSWTTLPTSALESATPFAPHGGGTAIDLAHAAPPAPVDAVRAATAEAVDVLPSLLSGHGYGLLGLPELRAAVAERFNQRGLPTTPGQIMITSGAQHGFSLVLQTLVEPGARVLVEHPSYPNALDAIRQRRARPVPVGFDAGGWDMSMLRATVRDAAPRLGYLIPDFQNPTGMCMDDAHRAELVEIARRTSTPLVIDETASELVLDGEPPRPVAAFGDDQSVPLITIGSASKIIWGGLRIGWLRASEPVIRRIAGVRASMDMANPVIEQLVATALLPRLGEIGAQRRHAMRTARDHLRAQLAEHLGHWQPNRPTGGLSLWIDLGEPESSRLVAAASRHGVLLAAGPRFGVDGAFERFLRLPYTQPAAVIEEAVPRLAMAWLALGSTGSGPVEQAAVA